MNSMETAQKYLTYNNKDLLNDILDSTKAWPKDAERTDDPREFSWYYLNHERRKMSKLVDGIPSNIEHFVMAAAPLTKTIWVGGADGYAREVDTAQLKVTQQLKVFQNEAIESIAVSPDNNYMAVGDSNGLIHLYTLKDIKLVSSQKVHSNEVGTLVFTSNSSKLLSSGQDGKLIIHDLKSGSKLTYQSENYPKQNTPAKLFGMAILPDEKHVAVCSQDNRIRIIDISTAKLTNSLLGHFDEVIQAIVSTNRKWLVSASRDRTIAIWDLTTMELANQISMDQNLGQFNSASQTGMRIQRFSSFTNVDGMNAVAIDLGSGHVEIFGIPSGSRIGRLNGHSKPVTTITDQPWDHRIASFGRDFTMRVWDQPCRDLIPNVRFLKSSTIPMAKTRYFYPTTLLIDPRL